jgi:hypothetical protein
MKRPIPHRASHFDGLLHLPREWIEDPSPINPSAGQKPNFPQIAVLGPIIRIDELACGAAPPAK